MLQTLKRSALLRNGLLYLRTKTWRSWDFRFSWNAGVEFNVNFPADDASEEIAASPTVDDPHISLEIHLQYKTEQSYVLTNDLCMSRLLYAWISPPPLTFAWQPTFFFCQTSSQRGGRLSHWATQLIVPPAVTDVIMVESHLSSASDQYM